MSLPVLFLLCQKIHCKNVQKGGVFNRSVLKCREEIHFRIKKEELNSLKTLVLNPKIIRTQTKLNRLMGKQ